MPDDSVVILDPETAEDPVLGDAHDAVRRAVGEDGVPDLDRAVEAAVRLGTRVPLPGSGRAGVLWSVLATLGAADLTVARVVEPHLDALAILAQAADVEAVPHLPVDVLWGVYAAEGPGVRLCAEPADGGGWRLEGTKPWCSLADRAGRALVTAWVDDTRRGLFAVSLHDDGVSAAPGPTWAARGLAQVVSGGLRLDGVAADAVGAPGWYLERPGFAWGGIGVAAVWYGGAVGVARRLLQGSRRADQVADLHLGAVDTALAAARAVLVEAAREVDAGCEPTRAALVAARARQVVADCVEDVVRRAGHALGPGPLTAEEDHARRVADLAVYVRQHHAERDLATSGAAVRSLTGRERGW